MEKIRENIPGGGRSYLLDFLRICLCVGVVVYHYTPVRPSSGPFMVNGFFVLSGFFASLWLHQVVKMDVGAFYHRKLRRLVPMFSVALLLGVVIKAYMAWRHPEINSIFPNSDGFDWGNFSLVHFLKYYNVPLWYMGIEFAFLLVVPFIYYLGRTSWGMWIVFVGSVIFAGFLFSRVEYGSPFAQGVYFSPIARFWQFMAGVMVARLLVSGKLSIVGSAPIRKFCCFMLFALFLAVSVILMIVKQESCLHWWNYTFNFDLLTVAFYMVLIPFLYLYPFILNERAKKWLRLCSDMTYPVFLVHVPVYAICIGFIQKFWGCYSACGGAIASVFLTLLLARLMLYGQKRYFPA